MVSGWLAGLRLAAWRQDLVQLVHQVTEVPSAERRPGAVTGNQARQRLGGQLQHLLDMMMLPSVSFGVIPMDTDRRGHRPRVSFDITDSDLVTIEMLSGFLSLTHPDEIGAYVTAWEHLFSIAVRGKSARALVKDAIAGYDGSSWPHCDGFIWPHPEVG